MRIIRIKSFMPHTMGLTTLEGDHVNSMLKEIHGRDQDMLAISFEDVSVMTWEFMQSAFANILHFLKFQNNVGNAFYFEKFLRSFQ